MAEPLSLVVFVIAIALIFDFGNGLNDAANTISTIVATKVLTFNQAVIFAAIANFAGVFIFGVAVAKTVGKGLINTELVTTYVVLAGLAGAISCVYLATYFGLPISASHSLIGGYIGASIAAAGWSVLILPGIMKVLLFVFLAPIIGMIGGWYFSVMVLWIFRRSNPNKIDRSFKRFQLASAFAYGLSHGSNDAQKTIGIVSILLFSAGYLGTEFHIPFWVIMTSYIVISLGTLAGGARVVKTMGVKITKLRPVNGFCAETAGALTIMGCSAAGIPVSTTHVISGSIIGVGATKRLSAVRWGVARNILWAWVMTIPMSALVGAIGYFMLDIII